MPLSLSATDLVAIVDDDPFVRAAVRSLVRSLGGNACEFASGAAFLASDVSRRAGCLICDVQMPAMDGIDLLARIDALGLRIPTLFVTAFATARERERVRASTALCLLEKPLDARELETWLARALGYV
ncbi:MULTISPECIES: response regulator transcription factor [Burkholderia]|uniref:Response regulator receiver protein n=2 Tax=Burkholderia cepacia complex TaxID=87882 RepID=A0AAW3PVI2_9BURK|nr:MULTISPECIES: response regulator [Burkholderia]KVE07974.1 response regulator receiver protein [Burkholderia anthina]KVH09248.1 response regulator receiver protein [Burkholderia anthina]KVH15072.1 response regulator receiver protein [Burkholderia anthina]KVM95148.1 response regulator receiver protein [Burkholderia anthina]KVX40690.1 response regulator receiver protein [Burkholderia anthina]